jgi:hypothetical protein
MMDNEGVIEVFTAKPSDEIVKAGGSQSWVLNPDRMDTIFYVVCVRNDAKEYDDEFGGPRPEPRNAAFFVGKVSGVKLVGERKGRNRYLITMSDYALLDKPILDFRAGRTRNPVIYSDVATCKLRGLDIEALDFQPMSEADDEFFADDHAGEASSDDYAKPAARPGLSIPEAKEGLSIFFGVPIENVQITISG